MRGAMEIVREHVDDAVREGASLDDVERDLLDEVPGLSEEARDALWLYAWGLLERQREEALRPFA